MKRKREYILIIAITCMSWGLCFPEYTFTADSYRLITKQETAIAKDTDGTKALYETEEPAETADSDEIRAAVRDGRVRYRLRFADYIKDLFF